MSGPGKGSFHALKMVWPLACRRLEGCPNINSSHLFEELCLQFPGRFNQCQRKTLSKRVKVWRDDARARGVKIDHLKYRNLNHKPRGRRPDPFKGALGLKCSNPWRPIRIRRLWHCSSSSERVIRSTTALRQLSTLERRVRAWRRQTILRLMGDDKKRTAITRHGRSIRQSTRTSDASGVRPDLRFAHQSKMGRKSEQDLR